MKTAFGREAEAATDVGQAIYVSVELSQSSWLVTSFAPAIDTKMARKGLPVGEVGQLLSLVANLRSKVHNKTGSWFPVVIIQEAGLDGFWIHRVLVDEGLESHVVDATSIAVPRKARRAKTGRIDGEVLIRALMAFKRGEPRTCAMVRVPSHDEEDRRRLLRERKALVVERLAHANRIEGLLFAQGISDYRPLNRDRRSRLEDLRTGDGRSLPPFLKAQISRELDRLELVIEQIRAIEAERDELLACERREANSAVSMLENVRGIGPEFASLLWTEGFYRHFDNRRQIAAYAGLAPTPWQSGSVEWAIVAISFPDLFTGYERSMAEKTFRNTWPNAWETIRGGELAEGESWAKDRRAFDQRHGADFIVTSAIRSDHHAGVNEVVAKVGGGRIRDDKERRFLVKSEEYARRGRFGFVIDLARHAEYDGPSSFIGWRSRGDGS